MSSSSPDSSLSSSSSIEACVEPEIHKATSTTFRSDHIYPAGVYRAYYSEGVIRLGGLWYADIDSADPLDGYQVFWDDGNEEIKIPSLTGGYVDKAQVAAKSGLGTVFTHTGGLIGIRFQWSDYLIITVVNYLAILEGFPRPTFCLERIT